MKKLILVLLLVLLSTSVLGVDYFNKNSLDINLRIASSVEIVPTESNYYIDNVKVFLYYFPEDGLQQRVASLETRPEATKEGGAYVYYWEEPDELVLDYSLEAELSTNDDVVEIRRKVNFPIGSVPSGVEEYLEPSEHIDSDNLAIVQKASELAEGEDDLFKIVFKLADWTEENVDYDINTLTEKVSQKASWVLSNRQGVCDELTSLFIAMCRSLGIPAKFVSGMAYSNDPRLNPWENHGWAEVYFSDYGWVPFDPTYGEFGFLDVTHIKLSETIDPGEADTLSESLGRDIDMSLHPINLDVDVKGIGGKSADDVDLDIEVYEGLIGFGSYNLIKVEVENLNDYYLATKLTLSSTQEVEISDKTKNIMLKPRGRKNVYWVLKLDEDLMEGYIYTFPVVVYSVKNVSARTEFEAREGEVYFTKGEIEDILESEQGAEEKIYSKKVDLICEFGQNEIHLGESTNLGCKVKNLGNTILKNLQVCFEKGCQQVDLGINQEKVFEVLVTGEEAGRQKYSVSVENSEVSKIVLAEYVVLDEPKIVIGEVIFPEAVGYDDIFEISFVLEKFSYANPKEAKVSLLQGNYPNSWIIEEFFDNKEFEVAFLGKNLVAGENSFKVLVEWKDDAGEKFSTEENFVIRLEGVTFGQRLKLWFKGVVRFLEGLVK